MTRPAILILAALGILSGLLGTFGLDVGIGDAPHPGIYMVLAGVWFGMVVGFGVWRWGNRSWTAAAVALVATWASWEIAVNLALQISENWLKVMSVPNTLRLYVAGFVAGGVGAFLTWAGAAISLASLKDMPVALLVAATGAVFGLLLPWTNSTDSPAILLVLWQCAVAGVIGYGLSPRAVADESLGRV